MTSKSQSQLPYIKMNTVEIPNYQNQELINYTAADPLYVVLFSGGRTSAFLSKWVKEYDSKYQNKIFIFVNTGKEREETLEFVDLCDKNFHLNLIWLEAVINSKHGSGTTYKVVDFKTASRKGEPFEQMLKKYPLPNNAGVMNCTRELKQRPVESYLRRNYKDVHIVKVIGIRHDEQHRKSIRDQNVIYPLCEEIKTDQKFIRNWWKNQPFDLKLKDYEGNCDLCFKKSLKKRLTIISESPKSAEWWLDMENKYSSEESPRFDLRTNLSMSEQIEMAKRPFTKAIDFADLVTIQPELFEFETDCFCKAT